MKRLTLVTLVLTTIILADEIADMKAGGVPAVRQQAAPSVKMSDEDEEAIVSAIDLLAARIDQIAGNLQKL